MNLRDAWSLITADDYDRHMAAVGQAEANAGIIRELFADHAPVPHSAILFAGAGTGQMFEFVSPEILRPFSATFTDINESYLRKLRARLGSSADVHVLVDDIEHSALTGRFALVIAVLVLEHVDVSRAIASMCALADDRVFVIVQENPPELTTAMTREPVGTMRVFHEVQPHLVAPAEMDSHFHAHSFRRGWTTSRTVLDEKRMVGTEFRRRR